MLSDLFPVKNLKNYNLVWIALILLFSCAAGINQIDNTPSYPDDPEMESAVIAYMAGDHLGSLVILERTVSETPNYFTAKLFMALNYLKLGWWESALAMAEGLIPSASNKEESAILQFIRYTSLERLEQSTAADNESLRKIRINNHDVLRKYKIP